MLWVSASEPEYRTAPTASDCHEVVEFGATHGDP
jgi:hypothetical protein